MSHSPNMLWPPAFKAAIFDFDGTISNTAHLWREVDRIFLGMRGLPYDEEYPRHLSILGFERGAQYAIDRFGLHETVEDICNEWNRMGQALYETQATLRPGAEEYIKMLSAQGIPVALATTNDPNVLEAMQLVDIQALFGVRVHGNEVPRPKSHPDIYLEAARRLGVAPQDCIVFEDIAAGIRSAKSEGMLTCGLRAADPTQDVEEVRGIADLFLEEWTDIKF